MYLASSVCFSRDSPCRLTLLVDHCVHVCVLVASAPRYNHLGSPGSERRATSLDPDVRLKGKMSARLKTHKPDAIYIVHHLSQQLGVLRFVFSPQGQFLCFLERLRHFEMFAQSPRACCEVVRIEYDELERFPPKIQYF